MEKGSYLQSFPFDTTDLWKDRGAGREPEISGKIGEQDKSLLKAESTESENEPFSYHDHQLIPTAVGNFTETGRGQLQKKQQGLNILKNPEFRQQLFLALLEEKTNASTPDDSQDAFERTCGQLEDAGLITTTPVNQYGSLRFILRQLLVELAEAFKSLVTSNCTEKGVVTRVGATLPIRVQQFFMPPTHLPLPLTIPVSESVSRYRDEFTELSYLGHGGFGTVFKARHKLDGQTYAIKKICFECSQMTRCNKIFREVQVLASLHHPHIVGYRASWLEAVVTNKSNIHHLSSQDSSSSSDGVQSELQLSKLDKTTSSEDWIRFSDTESSLRITELPEQSDGDVINATSHLSTSSIKGSYHQSRLYRKSFSHPSSGLIAKAASNSLALVPAHSATTTPRTLILLYIQMDLCSSSLHQWLRERNGSSGEPSERINEKEVLRLLKQLLEGLNYIHGRGLMHRDLKPHNVFLSGHELDVKIGDFGLARDELVSGQAFGSSQTNPITPPAGLGGSTHTLGVGTCTYAAPEQLHNQAYDHTCDLYSLGLIMYELYHPMETEMERACLITGLREKRHLPAEFCNSYPLQSSLITRLTSPEPRERPSAKYLLSSELFLSKDEVVCEMRRHCHTQISDITKLTLELRESRAQLSHARSELNLTKTKLSSTERELHEARKEIELLKGNLKILSNS